MSRLASNQEDKTEHVSSVYRAGCRRDGVVVRRISCQVWLSNTCTRANPGFLCIKNVKCGNTNKHGHVSGCPSLPFVLATCVWCKSSSIEHRTSNIERGRENRRSLILFRRWERSSSLIENIAIFVSYLLLRLFCSSLSRPFHIRLR
jgi:hypothetical protein